MFFLCPANRADSLLIGLAGADPVLFAKLGKAKVGSPLPPGSYGKRGR